jgi:hypothetical protein
MLKAGVLKAGVLKAGVLKAGVLKAGVISCVCFALQAFTPLDIENAHFQTRFAYGFPILYK